MKVIELIEQLQNFNNLDDEIIVEWWQRNFIEIQDKHGELIEIPLDVWNSVAQSFDWEEKTYRTMSSEIEDKICQTIEQEKSND